MNELNFRAGNPRRYVFYGIISLIFLILVIRFYSLQFLHERVYQEKSLRNSVKVQPRIPARGLIYDRNGILIADNRPSFSLYLVPAQSNPHTISVVSNAIGVEEREIKKNFRNARRFQPVKVARYVDLPTLTKLQENKLELPGLEWRVEPKRHYEYKTSFAHVLGYLGEVGESELTKQSEYEQGDIVGKKAIEKTLDKHLRGQKGYQYLKVNAIGQTVEELSAKENSRPHPGDDLYLTIDARLQQYADSLFGEKTGALVAIDVRNGEILSLVSKPTYNLDAFAEAIDPQIWNKLMADSLKPLFDRTCQATYPPGSTYKMIAVLAALNEGIVTPQWHNFCPGYYRIGRRVIRCWKAGGHGEVDMLGAIKNSCNVYFYKLGLKIGIDNWSKYSRRFRFGQKTGIELTAEKAGLVPSKEYYDKVYGKNGWTKGLIANIAIGQGELLVTPLQMAQFAMILADSGTYYQPHLTKKLVDKITLETQTYTQTPQQIEGIDPQVFRVARDGMRQVVDGGTGWQARVWKISAAGKTGTAQNPHGEDHAWYIGFAPFEEPEICLAVIVENGGSGGGVAAPIAGKYLRRYFYLKGDFNYRAWREYRRKLWLQQQKQARLDSLREAGAMVITDSLAQQNDH